MPHALLVDGNTACLHALKPLVESEGFTVACANSLKEAQIQLIRQQPDVAVIDLQMPDGWGLVLAAVLERPVNTEIVLTTELACVDSALNAWGIGASDYLVKPIDFTRLRKVLGRVPKTGRAAICTGAAGAGHFGYLLGQSLVMQRLYVQMSKVAPTEATVLLVGESGTGKELAAQTLHDYSRRANKPFLAINCGAISPQLIESELFGHERGSFTGADRQHCGYFERAQGGTLFLDEITEMPLSLQVKLLRVLESRRFMRIGTDRELETDVRLIAATNRDPEAAVAAGELRADLYHRLNVFPLVLPRLATRRGDVLLLAVHFLNLLNSSSGQPAKRFAPDALVALNAQDWPGNVRELRNAVQRAFILSDAVIEAGTVQPALANEASAASPSLEIEVGTSLAEADRKLILATLDRCAGARRSTAELLGISLKTLYNRLEQYEFAGLHGRTRRNTSPTPQHHPSGSRV
ncbi:MAG: sigma-54 dependent transcriptional regulator [Pseudomonadota bacterium]